MHDAWDRVNIQFSSLIHHTSAVYHPHLLCAKPRFLRRLLGLLALILAGVAEELREDSRIGRLRDGLAGIRWAGRGRGCGGCVAIGALGLGGGGLGLGGGGSGGGSGGIGILTRSPIIRMFANIAIVAGAPATSASIDRRLAKFLFTVRIQISPETRKKQKDHEQPNYNE